MLRCTCLFEAASGRLHRLIWESLQPKHLRENDACGHRLAKSKTHSRRGLNLRGRVQSLLDVHARCSVFAQTMQRNADQAMPHDDVQRCVGQLAERVRRRECGPEITVADLAEPQPPVGFPLKLSIAELLREIQSLAPRCRGLWRETECERA